jgi:hypothetical protein
MRDSLKFIVLVLLLGGFYSCSEKIEMPGFDAQKWKEDRDGCKGEREKLLSSLLKDQKKMIGHDLVEVKDFLGKPEANDLGNRGQKYFDYTVSGGKNCPIEKTGDPEILRVRFDALDRVTEVSVY